MRDTFRLAVQIVFCFLLTACPPHPKPTQLDMAQPSSDGPTCQSNAVNSQVCMGSFTSTGVACVDCGPSARGCFDTQAMVYCTSDQGCADPECTFQPNEPSQGKR